MKKHLNKIKKLFYLDQMSEPYKYTRYRWFFRVDLDKLSNKFRQKGFEVKISDIKKTDELSLRAEEELLIVSDTLQALVTPFRA
jgi:hypothetical protein